MSISTYHAPSSQPARSGIGLMTRISLLIGGLTLIIVAVGTTSAIMSTRVSQGMATLRQVMALKSTANNAYNGFLNMDDQSNMWVGMYGFGHQTLNEQTYQQILQGEQQLDSSLQSLLAMSVATPAEHQTIHQAIIDSHAYESYFDQIRRLYTRHHREASTIMYITNSNASNDLTNDLTALMTSATQRLMTQTTRTASDSEVNYVITLIGGVLIALFGIGLGLIMRRALRPIPIIAASLARVSAGDLTVQAIECRRQDEIGALAHACNDMVATLRQVMQRVAESAEQVAASSEELTASATETMRAAEHVSNAIQDMAQGAIEQSANASSGRDTITSMAQGLEQIASHAREANDSAAKAQIVSEEGQKTVSSLISEMDTIRVEVQNLSEDVQQLNKQSSEIGAIAEVITQIANQTNLLSLNAAIEAARAGEQGRGFAVVAEEVRKLAYQTGQSASQIVQVIQSIQKQTAATVSGAQSASTAVHAGISAVEHTGSSFEQLREAVGQVGEIIRSVSATVQSLSSGSQRVVQTIDAVAEVAVTGASHSQTVAASSEEQLATMEEVTAAATMLARMAEDLQAAVGQFSI